MVKAIVATTATYSITISGLSKEDLSILSSFMQNSPHGFNPNEEPKSEYELRKTIFEACKTAQND